MTNGNVNFAFYFTFENLTTEVLIYSGLFFSIYQRHRKAWIVVEKLPIEVFSPEQDILMNLQKEIAEKGIDPLLLDETTTFMFKNTGPVVKDANVDFDYSIDQRKLSRLTVNRD